MKISYRWLQDIVDFTAKPRQLAEDLTNCGVVVSTIEAVASDTIFELDLTTNRPDCLGHWGVAREIATLYKKTLEEKQIELPECKQPTSSQVSINIESDNLCRRYSARLIQGVRVGPSPQWICSRLSNLGINPINNVVDVTNLVLMEMGHPLHVFDFAKIENSQVIIRKANEGEKLVGLDGVERELKSEMLLIADPIKPLALAGIIGGLESEITTETSDILLESAWFDPTAVRKTAKFLGLHTEASHRFERVADIGATIKALNQAAKLIQQLAGGEILSGIVDLYDKPIVRTPIFLRKSRLSRLLGTEIESEEVEKVLESLDFHVLEHEKKGWKISLPTARMDVEREIDLIEEITRHYGYNRLLSTLPMWRGVARLRPDHAAEKVLTERLLNLGYSQILTYPFIEEGQNKKFSSVPDIHLKNPLSLENGAMRTSLFPGLLSSLSRNYNRGIRSIRVYEIGKVYQWIESDKAHEELRLGLLISGSIQEKTIHGSALAPTFFDIKGDIEVLLESLSVSKQKIQFQENKKKEDYWHPGASGAIWFEEQQLGILGQLHPKLCSEYKIRQPVFIAEIALQLLYSIAGKTHASRKIPRFPSIQRDLSIVVDEGIKYGEIEAAIWETKIENLSHFFPFDLYQGNQLPSDKKGISITLIYQNPNRTLVEEEAASYDKAILTHLKNKFRVKLRD
ncbi:MAG: phenylalanine--tRNA ligase subunit beta [Acidobacteriia bacterium]|nr:phenylalanine--tRNA ligase subunit beta [Terriglobia bacterium]